jgi:ferric-dicitrate binding protein FerR (iron transport regulator)
VVVDHGLAVEPVSGVVDLDRREASLNALAVLLGAEVTEITPYLALIHRP